MVSAMTNVGANSAKRYIEYNTSKSVRATQELASGSRAANPAYDPTGFAIASRLSASVATLSQGSRNVDQAIQSIQVGTGALGSTKDIMVRMKQLTALANADTIGVEEREMANEEYSTLLNQVDRNAELAKWGGISLFTGGIGTATIHTAAANPSISGAGTPPANTLAGIDTADTAGFIDGVVRGIEVEGVGTGYRVSVTVGDQTFRGTSIPTAGGSMILTSLTDTDNQIAIEYHATDITGLTDIDEMREALSTLLIPNVASFNSEKIAMPAAATFAPGAGTNAGSWAVSYAGGEFKITNGMESYRQSVSDPASASLDETISFGNGATITLAAFDATTAMASQAVFTVSSGTQLEQNFQYGDKSTDVLDVTFRSATAASLGLAGTNVNTRESAAIAADRIDAADQVLGRYIGELGGKRAQLESMIDTLAVNIENLSAARSTFIDANIPESMATLQRFKGLTDLAMNVFAGSLNQQQKLTDLIQRVG